MLLCTSPFLLLPVPSRSCPRLTLPLPVCPHCSNILAVSATETGRNRLECRTCPYEHPIEQTIFSRRNFTRQEKEDVFGGPGAWDNAQKQKVQCGNPACNGDEAAFFSVQIRSADEPMTVSRALSWVWLWSVLILGVELL